VTELSLWKVLILAVVQGITEFLPISSDGHLAVAMTLLCGGTTPEGSHGLIIVLHLGTLVSIIVFYWRRIWQLLLQDHGTIVALVIATIPAVVIGLSMKSWEYGDRLLQSPLLTGLMLPVTGLAVLFAQRWQAGKQEYQQLSLVRAWWIGVFQAFAILPGLSRSGSTIACGVGVGLTRPSAATFSFLLAIPVIAGAGVLECKKMLHGGALATPVSHMLTGAVVSFVVGLFAIWWVNRWIERGKLHYFAWYCFALGAVVIAWQLSALPSGTIAAGLQTP
jgi:undecaprenyl-diphosphatase